MNNPNAQSNSQNLILNMVKALSKNGIDAKMQSADDAIFDGGFISYSDEESIIWVHFYTDQPHSDICRVIIALAPINGWSILDLPMYVSEHRSHAVNIFGDEAMTEYANDILKMVKANDFKNVSGISH